MLNLAYIVFMALGCAYVLVAMFLGHGDWGGHGTEGGAEGGNGHADGHGALGKVSHTTFHFPFFSPLALATLCGSIGAYGLIALHGLGTTETASLLVAIPAAVATAYAVTYAGYRLIASSSGSSEIKLSDFPGAEAEVITPIPVGGLGEIAALVNGQRYTGPAREAEGHEVPRGTRVTIKAMVGTTFVVTR